jgi:hypothetical protein
MVYYNVMLSGRFGIKGSLAVPVVNILIIILNRIGGAKGEQRKSVGKVVTYTVLGEDRIEYAIVFCDGDAGSKLLAIVI